MGICVPSIKPSDIYSKLSISSFVCTTDDLNVFDHRSRMVAVLRVETPKDFSPCALFTDGDNFKLAPTQNLTQLDVSSSLLVVSRELETFVIKKPTENLSVESRLLNADETGFWVSIKDKEELSFKGVVMNLGDMFVLGRKILRIRSLNLVQGDKDIYEMIEDQKSHQDMGKASGVSLNMCRVCHSEESDAEGNPLLSPCKCTGSLKYIHFYCLRKMVENNKFVQIKSLFSISYNLKALHCEICLVNFPETLYKDGRRYPMINEDCINPPYVIFEVSTKSRKRMHSIHCIKLNVNNFISIGSSQISDIKIKDNFISPQHAKIRLTSNGIFLSDEGSQYGTFKFYRSIRFHMKMSTVILSFGRILLKLETNYPTPPEENDLPKKSNIKIRFSKLKTMVPYEPADYENILTLEDSDPEDFLFNPIQNENFENVPKVNPRQLLNLSSFG